MEEAANKLCMAIKLLWAVVFHTFYDVQNDKFNTFRITKIVFVLERYRFGELLAATHVARAYKDCNNGT